MSIRGDLYRDALGIPRNPRTGETPEEVLQRLAELLNCEPRQVCDRVIRILEEKRK